MSTITIEPPPKSNATVSFFEIIVICNDKSFYNEFVMFAIYDNQKHAVHMAWTLFHALFYFYQSPFRWWK